MLSDKVKNGSCRHVWAKLLAFGLNKFSSEKEGIVFLLKAEGEKDGKTQRIEILSEHDSGYDFTVIPSSPV